MSIRWQDLPDYEPPPLPSVRPAEQRFVLANATFACSVLLVPISAVVGGNRPSWLAYLIIASWLALIISGWQMCDRLARSIHLLGGRNPTRFRVARAWAVAPAWLLLMELTVLRMDATEVVDIRPGIAAIGFWVTAWRPFSVIRRITTTLTRASHDATVLAFGLLHVAVWSITWWVLRSSGELDLTGIAWAAALAAVCASASSVWVVRATNEALAHRILARQTFEEHRYVRSLGLNPYASHTFLDLVMAKQERARQRGDSKVLDAARATADAGSRAASDVRGNRGQAERAPAPKSPTRIVRTPTRWIRTTREHLLRRSDRAVARDPGSGPNVPSFSVPMGPHDDSSSVSPEPGAAADTRPAIRAASLEILRYASAGSLVLVAVTSVWSTIRAVSLAEPISAGRMAGVDVDHLDRARTMTSIALAIAAPMQAWWLVAAGRWMRRAGVPCSGFPALASALISTEFALAFGVGLVFGAPQRLLIPLLVLAGVGAWAAILTAGPIADWIGATPLRLNLWATGIILSTIVHAFAGGTAPVTPTTSVQTVAFASVVLGLVVANTAIVGGLFMLNFEDDIRSSSAIVRSFRTPRTRRNSDV